MARGRVVSIHIAPAAKAPMASVREIHAVAGKGLDADRYFVKTGTYSKGAGKGREVTLIEAEALEAMREETNFDLASGDARRNLVTRGVALDHLVGKDFRVGEVTLRGVRRCEPCTHLEGLTQAGVRAALVHRGGLRADILAGGASRVGDAIVVLDSSEEQNKELIRRYYDEMWNPWNFAACDWLLASDIAFYGSLGVATQGIAAFRDYMQTVRAAFPDFHNTIEEMVAENDRIVARLTYRGTHRGEIFGLAPSGKKITYAGTAFFRIAAGKVAEGWVLGDRLGLLQQLGAASAADPLAEKVKN
jgi:steroid delta-isomerase-like uncharacterized protein